ncbi:hypothetical protein ACWPKS_16005 [Coraliomargarita sp. W4R72]
MSIIRHHRPVPRTLTPQQSRSIRDQPKAVGRLGDKVAIVAAPIAKACNKIGQPIERLGTYLVKLGQPGSTCKCKSRQACLNRIAVDLKHPLKTLAAALQCWRRK